jgi:hypothetical protein
MFFRHQTPRTPSFDERISGLSQFGFSTSRESGNRCKVSRKGCAAIVEDLGDGKVAIDKAGVSLGSEIATLVHGGYQMFVRTPSGKEAPALASHLKELHSFDEDLREGLGLTSLYNESLGTTCEAHLYDRVVDRDHAPPAHPWEK